MGLTMSAGATNLSFADAGRLVDFLKDLGADRVRHSKRTFLEHLVGTAAILERWGGGERVCKAGLFHSIYGTSFFRGAIISFAERARVAVLLGAEAERLAYVFCAFDRSSAYRAIDRGPPYHVDKVDGGEPIAVSEDELRDLLWIIWANALEQAPQTGLSAAARIRSRDFIAKCARYLPDRAAQELRAFYAPSTARNGDVMTEPGLRALLNLEMSTEEFLAKVWPEQLHIAQGPVERLAGLVDHDFEALVKMKKHHTKAFFRTVDGASTSIMVEPGQERPLYDAGFTIYFHNLSSSKLTEWVSALDEELGLVRGVTRVAAFASRRGQGLKPHYDQNDNFVCQAQGTKRWRIWPNTSVRHPTVGYTIGAKMQPVHEVEAPDGFPTEMGPDPQIVEMRPGTVMFMPRGMWHDTQTVEAESLHFNIQSGLAMWKDAIEYVLTRTSALHREDLREPIIGLFQGDTTREGFGDELKKKLREVVDEICDSEIVLGRQPFFKYITSRRPRT